MNSDRSAAFGFFLGFCAANLEMGKNSIDIKETLRWIYENQPFDTAYAKELGLEDLIKLNEPSDEV